MRRRTNFRPIENSCARCSVHTGRLETYKHLRRQALRTFHRQNRGQIFCRYGRKFDQQCELHDRYFFFNILQRCGCMDAWLLCWTRFKLVKIALGA